MTLTGIQGFLDNPARRFPLQLHLFSYPTLCCSCFRLRTTNGRWTRHYVREDDYPRTEFSHGICPGCFKQLYPSVYRRRTKK